MTETQANQPVFQTPNPKQLKKAAKEDPIQEREGAKEMDVADDADDSKQIGREVSTEMANSQATITNLGGH